jgi:hypothetical protein
MAVDAIVLKTCRYCLVAQPQDEFEICRVYKGKAYRRLKCKKCKHATQMRRRARLKAWLDGYKKRCRCLRCGFRDFRALEFHHRNKEDKEFNVADMVKQGWSVAAIKREIAKCIVLCANCHLIAHYEERNGVLPEFD